METASKAKVDTKSKAKWERWQGQSNNQASISSTFSLTFFKEWTGLMLACHDVLLSVGPKILFDHSLDMIITAWRTDQSFISWLIILVAENAPAYPETISTFSLSSLQAWKA
jgi:hypothetical protein